MARKRCTLAIFNESARWTLPDPLVARIREAAGEDVLVTRVTTSHELMTALPETNYLIGFPATVEAIDEDTPALEWIQLTASGGDSWRPVSRALERGIRVCSAATMRAPFVAEHCVALTLAMIRRIDRTILAQAEHRWATEEIAREMGTLRGATVGIVAFQTIGDEIAKRCRAFDARVLVATPTKNGNCPHAHSTVGLDRVRDVVSECDALIVAAPRLPGTGVLLGKSELSALKTSAVVISAGRGGLVDNKWLVRMLQREKIAGAAMDVFETEPLPQSSPIWTMPNVIVSPHVSTASPTFWVHAAEVVCENLRRLARGDELVDELDGRFFLVPAGKQEM